MKAITVRQPWAQLIVAGVKTPPWWDRFWSKVDLSDPDGCWPWLGAKDRGYGQFKLDGNTAKAYRVAYELLVGPIPDGMAIDHAACTNPPCVNPAHMEVVTRGENARREADRRTECRNGHPWIPENIRQFRDGRRTCRVCFNAARRARRARGES